MMAPSGRTQDKVPPGHPWMWLARDAEYLPSGRSSCCRFQDEWDDRPVVRPEPGIWVEAGADVPPFIAKEGLLVVLEGLVAQCVWASPGKRRITGLLAEGDLSSGPPIPGPDRDWFTALTACRIAVLPWEEADRLADANSPVGPTLWHVAARWTSIQREWLRNDARPSEARLAHRVCEVMTRAGVIVGHPAGVALPHLRQTAWADMTAMTSVHVNRCLGRMAQAKLIRLKRGAITVAEPAKLMAFAEFDASYLRSAWGLRERSSR